MAGINKNSSRGSGITPGSKAPSISAEVSLIQVLNAGKHARVLNPLTGGSSHVAVPSEEFQQALARLDEAGFAERVTDELARISAKYQADVWVRVAPADEEAMATA